MSAIQADSFDDLAQQCVMSSDKHRMLYVFLRVDSLDAAAHPDLPEGEEATMVQVLFDAHQPAAHGLTFASIRETADAHNGEWNLMVVGIATNADASLPNDEQAQSLLGQMRENIMAGDVDGYALLDRNGQSVDPKAEVVAMGPLAAMN